MKPTFRKRYIGPGYWIERHPAEFCYSDWNFDPANARRYGSVFGWYKAPLNMDALMKSFYEICRQRELNPRSQDVWYNPTFSHGLYDFLMQPQRPESDPPPRHEMTGRHGDDIAVLPLGATLRPG